VYKGKISQYKESGFAKIFCSFLCVFFFLYIYYFFLGNLLLSLWNVLSSSVYLKSNHFLIH